MARKIIAVSGTPATGKTTFAKKLAKETGFSYIDVNEKIKEEKLYDNYDRSSRCYVVDEKKLERYLEKLIKKSEDCLVLDSHMSHLLPKKLVDLCIITLCDISVLNKRLIRRGYPKKKVRDNLDSEIFEVCLQEAREKKHKILAIDCSKKENMDKNILKTRRELNVKKF